MTAAMIVFGLVVAVCVAWIVRAALHDHRRMDLEDTGAPERISEDEAMRRLIAHSRQKVTR